MWLLSVVRPKAGCPVSPLLCVDQFLQLGLANAPLMPNFESWQPTTSAPPPCGPLAKFEIFCRFLNSQQVVSLHYSTFLEFGQQWLTLDINAQNEPKNNTLRYR
jgi:hypothetical protein